MLLSAITNNQTEKKSSMKRLATPPAWRECVGLVQEDDGGPRQAGTPERIPQRCLALTHVHAVQLHGGAGGGGQGWTPAVRRVQQKRTCVSTALAEAEAKASSGCFCWWATHMDTWTDDEISAAVHHTVPIAQ